MIRPAVAADRPRIAALQIKSWRDVYRGLLPVEYLDVPVFRDLTHKWAEIELDPRDVLLVAEGDGPDLAGFVFVEGDGRPYVDNLHVDPALRGSGIGARLMAAAARALLDQGDSSMWLTVMVGNHAALRFYERIGGKVLPARDTELYGNPIRDIPIEWPDAAALEQLASYAG